MLRFLTAGESHGPALTIILEGLPAGLTVPLEKINLELARRQRGHGRGGRQLIERDQVQVLAGLRHGETLGSPLALLVKNRDWENWQAAMDPEKKVSPGAERITRPRPGHADLAGALKYGRTDIRDILERASARETAARVAGGAVAKILLEAFKVGVGSWVEAIGGVRCPAGEIRAVEWSRKAETSPVRCPLAGVGDRMCRAIDRARKSGDTLGGIFAVAAWGLPVGLGSHVHWDRRLDARLGGALLGIPAVKGVEFGLGFAAAVRPGSRVHDPIYYRSGRGYFRKTNHAGGLEGGMTTGEILWARAAMKPIATLGRNLGSVDMADHRARASRYERSDVCAVPAAAVVGEAVVALELARAFQEKFGGDSLREMKDNWQAYLKNLRKR